MPLEIVVHIVCCGCSARIDTGTTSRPQAIRRASEKGWVSRATTSADDNLRTYISEIDGRPKRWVYLCPACAEAASE